MYHESGSVTINAENIFPIIKKWLYSEKDIFVRELVSNASDAISKLAKLGGIGEAELKEDSMFRIDVFVNKDDKTVKITDNGIGMTAEEVKKYINQVAFSGAKDFIEKYKDKTDENQIIGHFGLGFYSAFMVSSKVRIDTLSYLPGSLAVSWESDGGTDFEMGESDRNERGTTITLTIADDSVEFLDENKMRETLEKYFSFLPYDLYLDDRSKDGIESKAERAKKIEEAAKDKAEKAKDKVEKAKAAKEAKKASDEAKKASEDSGSGESTVDSESESEDVADEFDEDIYDDFDEGEPGVLPWLKPLNDTKPLWLKNTIDCTDDEYKSFFNKTFKDMYDPLFWIHLNMDYPFRLKGILYFPKLKNGFEGMEGQIKLYYNQVFVADNIKEVIPDFLMLLKGVLDCPDLPLNVSRSFLQNDSYVGRISSHITKKVGDKLVEVFEKDREVFHKYWDDINPFVKYGCIKEQKFYDRVKDAIVYKTINDTYLTLTEYLEEAKEKHPSKVFYVTDEKQQAQYIRMLKDNGLNAVIMNNMIDNHFIQTIETKETGTKFLRIDSDISQSLKDSGGEIENLKESQEKIEKIFRTALNDEKLKVKVENLKAQSVLCWLS